MFRDTLMRVRQGRYDFLTPDYQDQVRRRKRQMRELTSGGGGHDQFACLGKRVNTAQIEVGNHRILSQLRLFWGMLFREDGIVEIIPAVPLSAEIVDEPNLFKRAG